MSLFKLYVVENSVLVVCMGFNQYNLGHHLPCLMGPKFYAAELKGSGEEDSMFSSVFLRKSQFGALFEQNKFWTTR